MHQNIKDLLTMAVESSAITYWAKGKDEVWGDGKPFQHIVSFKVADAGPDGDPVKKGWKLINEHAILKARDRLVNGKRCVNNSTAAQFIGLPEDWEYDGDGVDALIQIAFFGEIVYG